MNNRRDFLKVAGLAGVTTVINPLVASANGEVKKDTSGTCVLIPTETAGPFPLDLTENSTFFRKDIKEAKTGVPLRIKMKILGENNCEPMPNVRVNIWHCDKDGLYSGYSQTNNQGQAGLTYLRGYQIADANGIVEFDTIFPGWYTGRICHIHFQVFVSSVYAAISQLTFDIEAKNSIYSANPTLYTKGKDPMTLSSDNIFSDGYTYQLASLTPNADLGGYDAYLEVTVKGSGTTTGLYGWEPETGGEFVLQQNFPNPCKNETRVPFELKQDSNVQLDLWDIQGKKVAAVFNGNLSAGKHNVSIDFQALGIPLDKYAFQLQVTNANGTFRQSKLITPDL